MTTHSEHIKQYEAGLDTYEIARSLHYETFEKYRDMFIRGFGVSVNPGWYGLVDELLSSIRSKTDNFKILQIKEKFGGLRVYYELDDAEDVKQQISDLIIDAEKKASMMCEICSSPGSITRNSGGWTIVACEKHRA